MGSVAELGRRAKKASRKMGVLSSAVKNSALESMARALTGNTGVILEANDKDLEEGRRREITAALMDRLTLNSSRVEEMAAGLREVAFLPDPVGEVVAEWNLPNGLEIKKVRVPLGTVGIIYEARPNVTVDAAGLCVKSGNSVILRGSSIAINSNTALTRIIAGAGEEVGLPKYAIQLVESVDRESAKELMTLRGYVDALIPRGGAGLIKTVVENSTVPVIETGVGNCHTFVDKGADQDMALRIVVNAKCQRPGICNACETLLVHKDIADEFIPLVVEKLRDEGVTIKGCEKTRSLVTDAEIADEEDYYTEFLDLILAVKVIDNLDEAIEHINKYGSGHSDAIITSDDSRGKRFVDEVDSSTVYINASTRFTDGGQLGLGAEIGISTQKLHARGPMSLPELTTTKYVVKGTGQIR